MDRAICSSAKCNAQILWVYTRGGKRMPLDAEPTSRGWVVDSATGVAKERNIYTAHFATCPDAERFRKPKSQGDLF